MKERSEGFDNKPCLDINVYKVDRVTGLARFLDIKSCKSQYWKGFVTDYVERQAQTEQPTKNWPVVFIYY